jgi:hypothetical protein
MERGDFSLAFKFSGGILTQIGWGRNKRETSDMIWGACKNL